MVTTIDSTYNKLTDVGFGVLSQAHRKTFRGIVTTHSPSDKSRPIHPDELAEMGILFKMRKMMT